MGLRSPVSRSTLAEGNESRNWRIYADLAQRRIFHARKLHAAKTIGVDLEKRCASRAFNSCMCSIDQVACENRSTRYLKIVRVFSCGFLRSAVGSRDR